MENMGQDNFLLLKTAPGEGRLDIAHTAMKVV